MRACLLVAGFLVWVSLASAQDIISVRAGWINYKHGHVILPQLADGNDVRQLEAGQEVATRQGRVEVLLTPGSFLRLDLESQARLVANELSDVQVEPLSGMVSIEINETHPYWSVATVWRGSKTVLTEKGLYRFHPGVNSLGVYVVSGKLKLAGRTVKSGHWIEYAPDGTLVTEGTFNPKDWDDFGRWNYGRSQALSRSSGYAASEFYRPAAIYPATGLWYWDPYIACYTYLPYRRRVVSPFGFGFTAYIGNGHHRRDSSDHGRPPRGRQTPPAQPVATTPSTPPASPNPPTVPPRARRGGDDSPVPADPGSARPDPVARDRQERGRDRIPVPHPIKPGAPVPGAVPPRTLHGSARTDAPRNHGSEAGAPRTRPDAGAATPRTRQGDGAAAPRTLPDSGSAPRASAARDGASRPAPSSNAARSSGGSTEARNGSASSTSSKGSESKASSSSEKGGKSNK